MNDQTYIERLEEKLILLLEKEIEEFDVKEINVMKVETAEKMVLWYAIHGSKTFDVNKL